MTEKMYALYVWHDDGRKTVYEADTYETSLRKMALYTSSSNATRAVIYKRLGRTKKSALKVWTKPI